MDEVWFGVNRVEFDDVGSRKAPALKWIDLASSPVEFLRNAPKDLNELQGTAEIF